MRALIAGVHEFPDRKTEDVSPEVALPRFRPIG
jgi:hypothetical protein